MRVFDPGLRNAARGRASRSSADPKRRARCSVHAAALAIGLLAAGPVSAQVCPAHAAFDYLGTPVLRSGADQAWFFVIHDELVDADGAPNAYSPADVGKGCPHDGVGLDCAESAGYPDKPWWPDVLVRDPDRPDQAYVQTTGPYRGFFVSQTSLRRPDLARPFSPDAFVDAARVPYLVIPAPLRATAGLGQLGDVGYALNLRTGRRSAFVIADEGPLEPLGEASIAFWGDIGQHAPNPRDGEGLPRDPVAVVVFPNSGAGAALGWPIGDQRLQTVGETLLASLGGAPVLRSCAQAASTGASRLTMASPDADPPPDASVSKDWPHEAAALFGRRFDTEAACTDALHAAHDAVPPRFRPVFAVAACLGDDTGYRVGMNWPIWSLGS